MSGSFVDADVLKATADKLTALADDVPGMLRTADSLDVGHEVGQLRTLSTWATETAIDLRARVGLIHRMEAHQTKFDGFSASEAQLKAMAGASMPVDEQLYTLEGAQKAKLSGDDSSILSWDGSQNFSDWLEKVETKAVEHLPLLGSHGELISKGIHAFHEYQNLLQAGGMASVAVANLSKSQAYGLLFKVTSRYGEMGQDALRARGLLNQAQWLQKGIKLVDDLYTGPRRTLTAPGSTLPWLKGQAVKYILKSQSFEDALNAAREATNGEGQLSMSAKILNNPLIKSNMDKLVDLTKTPASSKLAALTGNIFGRPWTTTVVRGGVTETVTVGRNATNLLKVFADGEGVAGKFAQVAKVGGALRVLGVAGSAFATVDSTIGVVNGFRSGELQKAWSEGGTQGKAKVIGDVAEVGFNASLTAAMIAPNPVTWGAVAVTGIVYGGARLVEHWDDVTGAVSDAGKWVGDKASDAYNTVKDKVSDTVDDVKDGLGDAVDAVKDSPVNPGNWF
ncbi:hypothetical protein D9V37_17160 [Nocardioides mangrovicus]|uniref:Uncharacterized protein n=1 Tax=Nocardioides mangrovicus TaxID=2478913 RepID=A0A3L8P0F0_9ACTN|nr:hypothetical protein [Nocardioides mangrovicus]RLV47848.1 hypothetical protein D9V37_17160 [Nocardioides mangrovicus]